MAKYRQSGKDESNATAQMMQRPFFQNLAKDPVKNAIWPWLQVVEILETERLTESTARAVFRFPVQHEYLNPLGNLHGGLAAAMYDVATTWTLEAIQTEGFWSTLGTSRTLNITYMRPAREGEMLVLHSEIVHAGKRLCLIRAELKRERDGAIISTCEHQKFNDAPEVAKA